MTEDSTIRISRKEKSKKSRHPKSSIPENTFHADKDVIGTVPREKRKKLNVQMEILSDTSDQIAPFVGYFPSGYDPLESRDSEITVFRNKKRTNRVELVVSPNECNVEFVGKSYTGEAAGAQICTYALGVLDKESRSLKIVPISTNKILRMEPRIIGKEYVDTELNDQTKDGKTWIDNMRVLTNLYGAKKNKGMSQKFQALVEQQNNPDAKEYLENQMKGIQVNKEALENATEVVLNIPPHDCAASTPEKAYLLDKIISKAVWNNLSDILEMVQSGEDLDSVCIFFQQNAYPSFVVNRIGRMREIKDQKRKEKLARIFSYITHLVKFVNLFSRRNFKVVYDNSHNIPQKVFQNFVKLFVDPESQVVSSDKKDLLISYILVLTLFADKFNTTLDDIAKDLKKTKASLKPHYLQLGCKFDSEGVITLPVPLKFPDMKVRRRRN